MSAVRYPVEKPSWKHVALVALAIVAVAIFLFEQPLRLRFSRERAEVVALLEQDSTWRSDIDLVIGFDAEPNPHRGRSSPSGSILAARNWMVDDQGGYFTFQVRGWRGPTLSQPASCYIRVTFEKKNGRVTRLASIRRAMSPLLFEMERFQTHQAPEPTPTVVTSPAEPPRAPAAGAAHR